jgi:hypothetical protein
MAVTRLTTNGLTGTKYDIASADNYYMEPIATTLLSSTTGTITFSNIPQNYKHLEIRFIAKAPTAGGGGIYIRYQSDSGSNYSAHNVNGNGATAGAQAQSATSTPLIIRNGGISTTANIFSAGVISILDYSSTYKNKTLRSLGGQDLNGSGLIEMASTCWYNTGNITSIELIHNGSGFVQYSRFSLYGIKG